MTFTKFTKRLLLLAGLSLALFLALPSAVNSAPVARVIAFLSCNGYGAYTGGPVCPPPPPPEPNLNSGVIAFQDFISGPATGVNDGTGSGQIVTIWGWFGATQGANTVEYCDSFNTCRSAPVYYWKNADGTLPGGPANLYESHGLQEVAISIPAGSAQGDGNIKFTIGGNPYLAPFRVRDGGIYFVASTGSDSNDGSWSSPFLTIEHALDSTPAGMTVYALDVGAGFVTGTTAIDDRGIYVASAKPNSTAANQFGIAAYPGYQPLIIGKEGIQGYQQDAMIVSKLDIQTGNTAEAANGQPGTSLGTGPSFGIKSSAYGRAIGNRITDAPGLCTSKTQGAIFGDADSRDQVTDFRMYGNEVYGYGCPGSDKLHHTTYFTLRTAPDAGGPQDFQTTPPWLGFNYLHENWTKNGIHFYDEDLNCGDFTRPPFIHDNVVINQAGAGLYYGTSGCDRTEDAHFFNNIVMNAGLPVEWNGLDPMTYDGHDGNGMTVWDSGFVGSTIYFYNNLIVGWDIYDTGSGSGCFGYRGTSDGSTVQLNDNICIAMWDRDFIGFPNNATNKTDNVYGSGNVFYYVGTNANYTPPAVFNNTAPALTYPTNPASPSNATTPTEPNLSGHITTDPLISFSGSQVSVGVGSPVIDAVTGGVLLRDIYGAVRANPYNAGPVE